LEKSKETGKKQPGSPTVGDSPQFYNTRQSSPYHPQFTLRYI